MSVRDPVVIVAAARTPIGGLLGDFRDVTAPQLGAAALRAALAQSSLPPEAVDEVLMGCVLSAGVGQAPARQAALGAGLPQSVPCTTISKVCGSGMKALMLAHDAILAGSSAIAAAGGMESMTNAPHLLAKARAGVRLGDAPLQDHMFLDGLQDAYDKNSLTGGTLMGVFAEACAKQYRFTREAQDAFAIASLMRAKKATQDGIFAREITPVTVKTKKGDSDITVDEQVVKADPARIPALKPAFASDGTITAANASSISDGAAALVLMLASEAEKRGIPPRARIVAHHSHAQEPGWFATAPIPAIRGVCARAEWDIASVDLFEINEAFAAVAMAAMHDLALPHGKVNIHGGACAMGHPIGASGARIVVTLLNALQTHNLKRGVASLCIGGGEAVAMAIERMS